MLEDWAKSFSSEPPKSEQLPLERHTKYATIQSTLPPHEKLVANGLIYPRWIEGSDGFSYERRTLVDIEYRIFDAQDATNRLAFDTETMAFDEFTPNSF